MMRRRVSVAVLAGVLLAGLVAVPGAPAGAQDIADLPRLGYEIDPDRGHVGDEVHSQVNVDDLREHCWDNIELTNFGALNQAYANGDITPLEYVQSFFINVGSYIDPAFWAGQSLPAIDNALGNTNLVDAWEQVYGPVPSTSPVWQYTDDSRTATPPEGIPDDQAGQDFVNFTGAAFSTASSILGLGQLAPVLFESVHITTFVDPATQELLGETGTFSPDTGEGTMLVPDLDPGLYAVVAACAFFPPADEFPAAYEAGLVAAWEASVACEEQGGENCFPTGAAQAGWADWAAEVGFPALLGAMFAPRAIGIDFYCILQPDGFCATPPGPVGLIDDDVIDEFNGDGPGDELPGPAGDGPGDAGDLVAVQAAPSFTG